MGLRQPFRTGSVIFHASDGTRVPYLNSGLRFSRFRYEVCLEGDIYGYLLNRRRIRIPSQCSLDLVAIRVPDQYGTP